MPAPEWSQLLLEGVRPCVAARIKRVSVAEAVRELRQAAMEHDANHRERRPQDIQSNWPSERRLSLAA